MEHYYSENPSVKHDMIEINYNIKNISLDFITDSGVFSKNKVDYGSDILIRSLPPLSGKILDLGCGYGPIGITMAKLNTESQITMIDINKRAVELTTKNIEKNNIKNAQVFQSNGFENIDESFNVIVSNPPIRTGKKVIYPMFEKSFHHLEKNGTLYLVIQKKQGSKSAMDKLIEVYGNCEAVNKQGGYWILKSIR